jgi:hypothetical protein
MASNRRILLASLVVAAFVLLQAGSAAAMRFEMPNGERGFRFRWISLDFILGANTINCEIRLRGSFHSKTINKVTGALVGYVEEAIFINLCTNGGAARFLTENLPWHIRYASFSGSLPRINAINLQLIGMRAQIVPMGGPTCLMTTTTINPLYLIAAVEESENTFASIAPNETVGIPVMGMGCPGEVRLRNRGTFSAWGEEFTSIQIRLIA